MSQVEIRRLVFFFEISGYNNRDLINLHGTNFRTNTFVSLMRIMNNKNFIFFDIPTYIILVTEITKSIRRWYIITEM